MTKNIKQDNRKNILNDENHQHDNLTLLTNLLNEGKDVRQQTVNSHLSINDQDVSDEKHTLSICITGNNNIVATQKSNISVTKKTNGLFMLSVCVLLFF